MRDLPPPVPRRWRVARGAAWLAGAAIVACLLAAPPLGVALLWNLAIPLVPALLVVAPGAWRNVCPLATTALAAERLGLSRGRKLPGAWRARLQLAGVAALLALIPTRLVLLNGDGRATGLLLLGVAGLAAATGAVFERKSGWCAGLCPLHPVERLYGARPAATVANAHCGDCVRCTAPCPDLLPGTGAFAGPPGRASRAVEALAAGAFPGLVAGWFQVPPAPSLAAAYGLPAAGAAIGAALWAIAAARLPREAVNRAFAAAGVAIYYGHRLPQLAGLDAARPEAVLVDLTGHVPAAAIAAGTAAVAAGLAGWLLLGRAAPRAWTARPPVRPGAAPPPR